MNGIIIKILVYLGLNVLAATMYLFVTTLHKVLFGIRVMKHRPAKQAPSVLYYLGKIILVPIKLILFVIFAPVNIFFIKKIKMDALAETAKCFRKHTPYENDFMVRGVISLTPPSKIKKLRFRCPLFDAYMKMEYYTYYDCMHYCPLYTGQYPFFILTDEAEAEYNKSVENESDLVDLSRYQL